MRTARLSLCLLLIATSASAQFITRAVGPAPTRFTPNQSHLGFQGAFDFTGRVEQRLELQVAPSGEHLQLFASATSTGGTVDPNRVTVAGSWGLAAPFSGEWKGGAHLMAGADWLRRPEGVKLSWATDATVGPRVTLTGWALHQASGLEFHLLATQTQFTRAFEATTQIAMAEGRAILSAGVGNIAGQTLVSGGAAVRIKFPGTPILHAYVAQDLTDGRTLGVFGLTFVIEAPGGNRGPVLEPLQDNGDVADVGGRIESDAPIESLGVPGKATIVIFCADWVHQCQTVWKNMLPVPKADPRIAVRRVNPDLHPAFTQANSVGRFPTVYVVDPKGKNLGSSNVYDERVLVMLQIALAKPVQDQPVIEEQTPETNPNPPL